jgi:hydrogenase maturation protease
MVTRRTATTQMSPPLRVLCLGNELLADDAFGFAVAEELRRRFPQMDVVFTTDSGFHLIDYLPGIQLLIVVDSIQTGTVPPGTLYVLRHSDIKLSFGLSPHYVGLFETLQLAKELLLNVPQEVIILCGSCGLLNPWSRNACCGKIGRGACSRIGPGDRTKLEARRPRTRPGICGRPKVCHHDCVRALGAGAAGGYLRFQELLPIP